MMDKNFLFNKLKCEIFAATNSGTLTLKIKPKITLIKTADAKFRIFKVSMDKETNIITFTCKIVYITPSSGSGAFCVIPVKDVNGIKLKAVLKLIRHLQYNLYQKKEVK